MRQDWVGRRQTVRQSCSLRAEARFHEGGPGRDCTITDISPQGARLQGEWIEDCPDTFDLFIPSRNDLKHARVIHRESSSIGVEFMTTHAEDPKLLDHLLMRLAEVEAKVSAPTPEPDAARIAALESHVLQLEAELAIVRGVAESSAERAASPDRLNDVQALRDSLTVLAERLERTAAAPQVEADPRLAELAREFDELRRYVAELAATLAKAATPAQAGDMPEGLVEDVTALRQSVQSLILLVSQLVARDRAAA